MNTKSCPCEGCITYAVCRHKLYYNLLHECSIITEYLDFKNYPVHKKRCIKLLTTLKPTEWALGKEDTIGFYIIYIKELQDHEVKSGGLTEGDEHDSSM